MSVRKKIIGTIEQSWQIGLSGVILKNIGDIEGGVYLDDEVTRAPLVVGEPSKQEHAATRKYVRERVVRTVFNFDGGDVGVGINPGDNTGFYGICHTSGGSYNAKQIYYDNGTTFEAIAHEEGRVAINTGGDFSGAGLSMTEDHMYLWDSEGSVWVAIGPVNASAEGALKTIIVTIGTNATYDSTNSIPTNAIVHRAELKITTPYPVGTDISIGTPTSAAKFMAIDENRPAKADHFIVDQMQEITSSETVRTTISNAPTSGAGKSIVVFSTPLT